MGWNAGVDRSSGDIVSAADWNSYNGASGSMEYLKAICDAPMKASKASGSVIGGRAKVNFIDGANITVTVADNGGSDQIDVTIASSGASIPTTSESSGKVTVTSAGVQGTKGAYTQLIASTARAVLGIILSLNETHGENTQWDIATGGAGAEVVKVADLFHPGNKNGCYCFPFSIPISTRVAIRVANVDNTTALTPSAGAVFLG